MKIAYYIITIILSALATGLFLLISFPLNKESMVALMVAAMLAGLLITSIIGLIKKSFIPGVMLAKAGIFLEGFAAFCIVAVYNGGHLSIPLIAIVLLMFVLGMICILEGINICGSKSNVNADVDAARAARIPEELREIPLVNVGLPADPDVPVKKIWQYKIDGKPDYSRKEISKKRIFILISCIGVFAGLILPMILMFSFGIVLYEEPTGLLLFLLSFISIFGFAITLAVFKEHHTEHMAFVLGEDGSVFMINYFKASVARDFGYYDLVPKIVKGQTAGRVANVLSTLHYPVEAATCLRYIRESGIDKRIAAKRAAYGHQISSVPEICRCGYFSEIRFTIWVNGHEEKYKNLFNQYDNCYEGYEEMIDYFQTKFSHCYDKAYHRTTARLRIVTGVGIAILCIGVLSFAGVLIAEIQSLYLPGFLGLLVGLSMLASGMDALRRRHVSSSVTSQN